MEEKGAPSPRLRLEAPLNVSVVVLIVVVFTNTIFLDGDFEFERRKRSPSPRQPPGGSPLMTSDLTFRRSHQLLLSLQFFSISKFVAWGSFEKIVVFPFEKIHLNSE